MNEIGDDLFADTAFTGDQNLGIAPGGVIDLTAKGLDGGAGADEFYGFSSHSGGDTLKNVRSRVKDDQ